LIILPLKYTSVNAILLNSKVQVTWSVAEENGVNKYEIERSADGLHFNKAGEIVAHGIANAASYQWDDVNPSVGNNYYRIRAVEASGNTLVSKTVNVTLQAAPSVITVAPNPVIGQQINLHATALAKGNYNIVLLNQQGQRVLQLSLLHPGGNLDRVISCPGNLSSGMYHLLLMNETNQYKQDIFINN